MENKEKEVNNINNQLEEEKSKNVIKTIIFEQENTKITKENIIDNMKTEEINNLDKNKDVIEENDNKK